MRVALFVVEAALAYVLPGWLALHLVELPRASRWLRLALAVPVSLVIVPFLLVAASNFIPLRPNPFWLTALVALLGVGVVLLRRSRRVPRLGLRARDGAGGIAVSRGEALLAGAFILLFTLAINLPRLDFLVNGNLATWGGSGDEYWHLAELVSVARSGLPPHHYFFPDQPLVYYYWSWIYPAILANTPGLGVSLARALAVHAIVQTGAFVGLSWYLLRLNFRSRLARWGGLWALTLAGGFDFFATLSMYKVEDWQRRVVWLVSNNQISSFPTLFMWVPQHVAGAMAFVMALLLWRNVRAPAIVRAVILALLAGFCLGSSAFIFLSMAIAGLVWMLLHTRLWWRVKAIGPMAWAAGLFAIGAGRQVLMSLAQSGGIKVNEFRVPMLEGFLETSSPLFQSLDRWLSLLGFPLVLAWVMLVEIGLPFALYSVWLFTRGLRERGRWARFIMFFPLLYLILTIVFTHGGPGRNFVTRGSVPAQIGIVLGAALLLAQVNWRGLGRLQRGFITYAAAVAVLTQSLTPFFDLRTRSLQAIGRAAHAEQAVQVAGITIGTPPTPWPAQFEYIRWINTHTPVEALIVETGRIEDDTRFRLLERMRLVTYSMASEMSLMSVDLELLDPVRWQAARDVSEAAAPLELLAASEYARMRRVPVYMVEREKADDPAGEVVYEDGFVRVVLIGRD
jgi:hypothetical protein